MWKQGWARVMFGQKKCWPGLGIFLGYGKSTLRNFESGDPSVSYIACAFKKTSYSFIPLLERRLLAIIEPSTRLLPFAGLLGYHGRLTLQYTCVSLTWRSDWGDVFVFFCGRCDTVGFIRVSPSSCTGVVCTQMKCTLWFGRMRLRLSQFASVVDRMCFQMQDSWEGMEMQRGDLKNSLSGVEWSSSGCWPRNQQKWEARSGAGCETNQPWWLRWIWMIGMEGLIGDHWKLCPLEAEGLCKDPLAAQPEINEGVEDLLVAVTGRWSCREFRRLGCRPM